VWGQMATGGDHAKLDATLGEVMWIEVSTDSEQEEARGDIWVLFRS
jgi:hypothetical protein